MNKYQRAKQRARDNAIKWQTNFNEQNYTWSQVVYWMEYFEKIGKRYGLLAEFRENGIC